MVNLIAVLGAAIASMVLGFLWYGPLFGKMWMELSGFKKEDIGKMKMSAQMGYVGAAITSLVMAYILALFLEVRTAPISIFIGAFDISLTAFATAFLIWFGFIATVSLGSVLWENKPFKLYLLNNAYNLLNLLVMAAILVSFP